MSDTHPPAEGRLVVYADYVCPFCYLGKASLEQFLADREDSLAVDWRPFDLRGYKRRPDGTIDHDVDDGKDDAYFEQAKQNVRKLKEKYDVEMDLDISFEIDSWNTHQAALFVREERTEAFEAFHDAVYDAMWQDGVDIGDPDELAALASSVGIDADAVREAVADDTWNDRLEDHFADAQAAGITGVPTFAYGDHVARGAVPPEQLRRLVDGV